MASFACFGSNAALTSGAEQKNPLEQAKIDDIYVRAGVLSIDEVRESLGKHPVGMANAVITTRGVFPLQIKGVRQGSGSPEKVQPDVESLPMPESQLSPNS